MKKLSLLFLSIFLIAFSAACSNNAGTESEENGNNNEEVELTFMMWGSEAHQEVYNELIAKFNETHPNIKVKIESVPFPDYQQKITVLAAGRELPDIGWVAERMVPQFMENGLMEDVSTFADDAEYNMDDFFPSTLDLFEKDDQLLGIPFSTPPMVIFYNKDLFVNAGEKTPNEHVEAGTWDWEQFEKSAKAISSDGVYGANFFRDWNTWIALLSHTWANGGDLFNEDQTDFTWNSPQGAETLKMLQRMMFEDGSHPKAGEQVSFESGKIGMFFDVYSYVSAARNVQDFEWDIAPLPEGPEGRFPMLGQAGYTLFKGSEHPEEARELLKFFTSQEGITATSTFFVPPRETVLSSDDFVNQPNNPPVESIQRAVIDEMDNARLQAGHIEWQKIDNAIQFGFDELFGELKEPEEILEGMNEKIDPLLK
ncbi:carbohydrate ABC transporter substrate-binding protein (CUT1 family) [Bacillus oleivorans]|uniref:Carbohydrate ABC transporter substrate-binding protein (CUT1 family) n=1 Tax=Bacillus oleivorans TaxID=1448271 RepID=A0A285D6P6_9BACI|nr:sugar ABC transporter substrate-binding protein [Bacillus oleivorans]SNX75482.1 carbohydrate ABC transporter substrate-binding protein (CUT1 family) [Bacillus oleivorans]